MGQALYRSYRSKKLSELVGQEHITTALTHALEQGSISHAYLFTGPRGTGKTSIARILAHEINNLPYSEDRLHLDIIEIDAASNRRIDEIRELRDKVHIAPTSAKYKVYIIDEVHMLTKEAFNALLKTLEEPPAHVIFMLATTEAHKLPETIVSRTQRFAFKPVELPKVVAHLKHIANAEKIDITDDALALVAAHGEGSFRDSISLLDQIRNKEGTIELADVQRVLGIASEEFMNQLIEATIAHDAITVTTLLKQMHEQGYEAAQIAKQAGSHIRADIINATQRLSQETAMKLLEALLYVPASPNPRIALEIALLDAALSAQKTAPAADHTRKPTSQPTSASKKQLDAPKSDSPAGPTPKVMPQEVAERPAIQELPPASRKRVPTAAQTATTDQAEGKPSAPTPPSEPKSGPQNDSSLAAAADHDMVLTNEAWDLVLNALKQKHNTLYSLAKTAQTHFGPGEITLELGVAFYQKRLNDAANKQRLATIIKGVTGADMQVKCILGTGKPQPAIVPDLPPAEGEVVHNVSATPTSITQKSDPVNAISDIFGGAELLES